MNEIKLSQSNKGKVQSVNVGDTIIVELPENPTTGFRWAIQEANSQIIELIGANDVEYRPNAGSGIGGGGTRTLRFKAKTPGISSVKLIRKRAWESDQEADDQFSFTVNAH